MQEFPSRLFFLPFIKKENIAKDTWTFYFSREKINNFYDFFPGQYNRVTLPIEPKDDMGNNRQFTISSSPTQKDYLTITTRKTEKKSDFKSAFFKLKPGTDIQFFGPLGGFYLREENKIPRVFLAGGIGITPFYSMIRYCADKNLNIPILLIVTFSNVEEVIFYDELSQISKKSNMKVVYSVTHPEASKMGWGGEMGRISESTIKKYVSDVKASEFMVTGPPPMVDSTVEILQNMHVPEDHLKVEYFTGY